jgi:molybdopterin-guanine dinucleotide biosynthesis protein A
MSASDVTGGILAGGRGLRMGGRDKGLIEVGGKALVELTAARLRPQVGPLLISANRNLDRYAELGFPVHADDEDGFLGPLAGIATLLARIETPYLMTVPCDTPGFPDDLAARLHASLLEVSADVAVTHDGEQRQFLFALYRRELADTAARALDAGERAIWRWHEKLEVVECAVSSPQAFVNVNTEADLGKA